MSEENPDRNLTTKEVLSQCQELFNAIFQPGDIIEFRKLPSRRSTWASVAGLDLRTVALLQSSVKSGNDVFFGINPRYGSGGRKKEDIPHCRSLMASFEGGLEEARTSWSSCGLPDPAAILESKNICVFFGRLDHPVDIEKWKFLQKALISVTGCKPLNDATRVLHAPGFQWRYGGYSRVAATSRNRINEADLRNLAEFADALRSL